MEEEEEDMQMEDMIKEIEKVAIIEEEVEEEVEEVEEEVEEVEEEVEEEEAVDINAGGRTITTQM